MTEIDWELRAYESELYRMRYTTRAPRDVSDIPNMNSEVRTGDPASPHRVKNFPIKSSCKIAYSCDQTWDRHPNGRATLREEPIDWLAANHCIKNSTTAHWSVVFPDQATALMFRLTWYR